MKYVIGIDEVGRGPLAGPVLVGVFAIPKGFLLKAKERKQLGLPELKDSKELSPKEREKWFKWIKDNSLSKKEAGKHKNKKLYYSLARISPKRIDDINIFQAANTASYKALNKLINEFFINSRHEFEIYLDGGLYIFNKDFQKRLPKNNNKGLKIKRIRTVIKGDEKITAVKLASIVAKVTRDKYMVSQSKKYPDYSFQIHKGYGTEDHFKAIFEQGPSPIHRLTFLKSYRKIT